MEKLLFCSSCNLKCMLRFQLLDAIIKGFWKSRTLSLQLQIWLNSLRGVCSKFHTIWLDIRVTLLQLVWTSPKGKLLEVGTNLTAGPFNLKLGVGKSVDKTLISVLLFIILLVYNLLHISPICSKWQVEFIFL